MSVKELKTAIAQLLVNEEGPEILEAVYAILNHEDDDSLLREEMNAGADEAEEDIAAGRIYTMDEVRSHLDKKFGK